MTKIYVLQMPGFYESWPAHIATFTSREVAEQVVDGLTGRPEFQYGDGGTFDTWREDDFEIVERVLYS